MNLQEELLSLESFAHAYVIEGDGGVHETLLLHLRSIGIEHTSNPDVQVHVYEQLGINESRTLVQFALRHPLAQARSIAIVGAQSLTGEAQNALLKTFEEPSAPVTFFLIVPSADTLLPTLRSRLALLHVGTAEAGEASQLAQEFLRASRPERLSLLAPLLKERSLRVLGELVRELERELSKEIADKDIREGLRAVYMAERYLGDKGSLKKVLLEQVALLVPRLKA